MISLSGVRLLLNSNPNHDRLGRFARAPLNDGGGRPNIPATSSAITSESEARAYWQAHFTGRTISFTVPSKDGKTARRFDVKFDVRAEHSCLGHEKDAYGHDTDRKAFDLARAILLDQISKTVSAPNIVIGSPATRRSGPADLFLARLDKYGNARIR